MAQKWKQMTTRILSAILWALMILGDSSLAYGKGESRQKVIDFEEQLVEGMNKNPLDSVSQVSERGKKRRKPHLYRKRAGFRGETLQTLRELRYVQ